MKHTKGPWQSLAFINDELQPNLAVVKIGGSNYTIGEASALIASGVNFLEERDKLKAVNAELLEALKNLCDWFDGETRESAHSRIDTARAAIAKAEGL